MGEATEPSDYAKRLIEKSRRDRPKNDGKPFDSTIKDARRRAEAFPPDREALEAELGELPLILKFVWGRVVKGN